MHTPDVVSALARTGHLGLDYVERPPLVIPDRRLRRARGPLWAPPPPVVYPWQAVVTSDATSSVFIPQSSSEWTTFNASNGWANPDHLWLFQEASGSILDKIGSSNLSVAGSPAYQQTVSGWSTKALKFTEATNNQRATNTAITNINTTSALCIFYANTPTQPAANRKFFSFGTTTTPASLTMLTTNAYRVDSVGNNTSDSVTTQNSASVKCFALLVDRTNNVVKGYCTSMAAIKSPVFASTMSGNEVCWGSADNGTVATITMNLLYAAVWVGANAEKTDQDIKSLMMQLGNNFWNPTWTVAYTASLSESETTSESVSVVVSDVVGLSESETTSESLAAVLTAAPALSESETTSASLTAVASDVIGLSESEATSEAQTAVVSFPIAETDSLTTSESIQVEGGPALDFSDTLTETEQLAVATSAVTGFADSTSTVESLAAALTAAPSLAESGTFSDAAAALLAAAQGLAETDAFAEALAVMFTINKGLADSLSIAEQLAVVLAAVQALAEETDTIEQLFVSVPYAYTLAEAEAIAEAVAVVAAVPARELLGVLVSNAYAGTLTVAQRLIGSLVSQAYSGILKEK